MSQYAAVWARAADEALPALSALEPLRHTPHLKYKIVFSVVVVSNHCMLDMLWYDVILSSVREILFYSIEVDGLNPGRHKSLDF